MGMNTKKDFRMDEETYQTLLSKAENKNMNVSKYLRMLIMDRPVDNPEIKDKLYQLQYEVNRIGNNINQIAKNCNADLYSAEDRKNLLEDIIRIEEMMDAMVCELRKRGK